MSNEATEMMGNDAQMGIVRVLRPYSTFATVYDGRTVTDNLIALSEGNNPLDPLAGQAGHDSRLVQGIPGSLGAKCLLWLPNLSWRQGMTLYSYVYTLNWRLRNVYDHRQQHRTPYHYPKQGVGIPETLIDAGPRVVIPAAVNSIMYVQAEPAGAQAIATNNLRHENFRHGGSAVAGNIINPDGSIGVIQQGVTASQASGSHVRPGFTAYELVFGGDELVIEISRETAEGAQPVWDFDGADTAFAALFGDYPDLGVYVLVGKGTT